MSKQLLFVIALFANYFTNGQKKPLDHSVYDGWQNIGERMISNDGKWVVYSLNPQEGDNELVIQSPETGYKKTVGRGYNAVITEDSRFVVFKIRPLYKETRDARIKKKKPDEMPKDSFAIVELGKDSVYKIARVKTFKTPEKTYGWAAYHLEKKPEPEKAKSAGDPANKKTIDSLKRTIDSLLLVISKQPAPERKRRNKDDDLTVENLQLAIGNLSAGRQGWQLAISNDAEGDEPAIPVTPEGTELVLKNLETGKEKVFPFVSEYFFSKTGNKLVLETTKNSKDSLSKAAILLVNMDQMNIDTLLKGGNDFKNFVFSEDGSQLAFMAERDAKPKDLQKFYRLWYFKDGMDSAVLLADKNSVGMKLGMTISEFGSTSFSKSGNRLFFGTAPIQPPKDTTLVEIDLVKLDIWHYNDDYLQTIQLNRLQRDLQENFLAVYDLENEKIRQIGSKEIPIVYQTNNGDGETFVGVTDFGKRVEAQWTGGTKKDIYAININDGSKKIVVKDLHGIITPQYVSPTGKYIMWYDRKARHYFTWDGEKTKNITAKIKMPLWNEEFDTPDDPGPYGVMRWEEQDNAVLIYDRYDIWRVDPKNLSGPVNITKAKGRKSKTTYRYIQTDPEERFIKPNQELLLRTFNIITKHAGITNFNREKEAMSIYVKEGSFFIGNPLKAKQAEVFIYTKEDYNNSPDLYVTDHAASINKMNATETRLSFINQQQKNYYWGTAELFKWKAYNGKETAGIVYRPENFDPRKKYPMICYFYETHSDGLYQYIPPSPTPSRLNISFFVSRGYIVFSPDIHYGTGHPARDCYNHVVSGARALVKKGFVDSTRIGIQGQSWGGIQVAQLVTMTNLFKAAWAGAPVANMTSAYGGIRWESGLNRQFQYEKSQSRIGATLWEKPNLYIENSPLFHLPKVKTPLVIMHNDADGAVPWYQGIELFTAMRRLGKKVWLLNYNGEAHNLVERKNRKDIQIREQQFFDWLLKGERPAKWITDGVPAVKKGREWGLEGTVF